MTHSRKLRIIVLTIHVFVAATACFILLIWHSEKAVALWFATIPACWLASLFCFHIAIPIQKGAGPNDGRNNVAHSEQHEIAKALNGERKISVLLSLADRAHAETMRYREHVWKVVFWTVILLGASRIAAQQSASLPEIPHLKTMYAFFAILVTAFGLRDVFFDYHWFVGNRNLQRRCERLLKLCERDAYQPGNSLLPERYQTEDYTLWNCVGHLIQWWFVIYAVSVYVILTILWV